LHVRVDPATPQVLISSTALSTVVDVLVENAARHGRGAVSIEATPARPAGAVIVVTDEGHLGGDRGALFQRRSPHAQGHGIGLALARSLAHAEGARLQLARIDPTTFEVLIAAEVPSGANDKVTV
jgi:signal transduction histidine kinase